MPAQLNDEILVSRINSAGGTITVDELLKSQPIVIPLGGQFLLDPNEFNGWGNVGWTDNSNQQDLGNVGVDPNRLAGGIVFPYDVNLTTFYAWHRNNNADALAWGWKIGFQEKNAGNNTVAWTNLLTEVADNGGTGPRNYANNTNQLTELYTASGDMSGITIPGNDVITLGVESPTAVAANRFVQIMGGYMTFERV